jgi:hypothetical protein
MRHDTPPSPPRPRCTAPLTHTTAPRHRSRNARRLQAQDDCGRQDPRALPRHARLGRQRVRRLVQPRLAAELQGRQRPGHQGLGPGPARHVPRREAQAHYPA